MIIDYSSNLALEIDYVGKKASSLSLMKRNGINIPDFFCISQESYSDLKNPKFLHELEERFKVLLNSYESIIVRSSGNLEDGKKDIFPGIFLSIGRITSFNKLLSSISKIYNSKHTSKVNNYCRLKGIDPKKIKLSIIVQGEIHPEYSGVIFTVSPLKKKFDLNEIYVEFVRGSSENMLAGVHNCDAFISTSSEVFYLRSTNKLPEELTSFINKTATKLNSLFKHALDIEWGYAKNQLFIFQARYLSKTSNKNIRPSSIKQKKLIEKTIFPLEDKLGLKGLAMKFFVANGLFSKNVKLIEPNSSFEQILSELQSINCTADGLTIRFSYKNCIGLPRFFAQDKTIAFSLIQNNWKPDWLIIIHDYFVVKHSFELYLDKTKYIIEHIPGMWESENSLEPDAIIKTGSKTTYMRFITNRLSKFVSPTLTEQKVVQKTSKKNLKNWNSFLEPKILFLRSTFKEKLPLNFHFVEDKNGQIIFLNIRRTCTIPEIETKKLSYHIIRDKRDIINWDGKKELLLQIPTKRGYEKLLKILVDEFPISSKKMYIMFGALSHPAIMLRELGINPIPIYLNHEVFN